MKFRRVLAGGLLLSLAQLSFAQVTQVSAETVLSTIQSAMLPAVGKLTAQAISWLGIFSTLQFFITGYNQLKSDGDVQSMVAKTFGAVAWVGVCLYLINNAPSFILAVGDQLMNLLGVKLPIVSIVIAAIVGVAGSLIVVALGVGAVSNTGGFFLAIVALLVLAAGLYLAFKIFMLQLEIGLIALLAPLSFALLGLNTLKDQGIAPFKSLLSLAYRIILLTVILSAFSEVGNVVKSVIESVGVDDFLAGIGRVANAIVSALGAYLLLVFLTFKADSIAASLASGSTSLGTGDLAQAAATGAAVGAAVAAGGATLAAGGGQAPKAMADFMGKMMGGGGSVTNASAMGTGGDVPSFTPSPAGSATPSAPAMSLGTQTPGGGGSTKGAASASGPGPAGPSSASVASRRFGPALPGEAGDVGGKSSTEQSSASDGSNAAQARGSDSGNISTAGSQSGNSPANDQGMTSAATEPLTVSPAGSSSVAEAKMPSATSPGAAAAEAAPVAPDSGSPDPASGSALNAGISGKPTLEENLGKLVDHLSSQQKPRKPTLVERVGDANRHVSQEQTATHVSVNTHHQD